MVKASWKATVCCHESACATRMKEGIDCALIGRERLRIVHLAPIPVDGLLQPKSPQVHFPLVRIANTLLQCQSLAV